MINKNNKIGRAEGMENMEYINIYQDGCHV